MTKKYTDKVMDPEDYQKMKKDKANKKRGKKKRK